MAAQNSFLGRFSALSSLVAGAAFLAACSTQPPASTPHRHQASQPSPTPPARLPALAGPYETAEAACSREGRSCTVGEPTKALNPLGVELRSYQGSGGQATWLGIRTARGWYAPESTGTTLGATYGHHSPASTWLDLDRAEILSARSFRVPVVFSLASFVPGRGPEGQSHHETISMITCEVDDGIPACGRPVQVYTRDCQAPEGSAAEVCSETGKKP